MRARRRSSRGFTLWELTMVLLVLAIAATIAVPAFARFGTEQPSRGADRLLALLHDSRKLSLDLGGVVTVRLDPRTLAYEVDTATLGATGPYADGTLDLGLMETLMSDQPRLTYTFRPAGMAVGDSVIVRGGDVPLVVRVDPWTGVARADSQ